MKAPMTRGCLRRLLSLLLVGGVATSALSARTGLFVFVEKETAFELEARRATNKSL